jgi:hypothetical protein
MHPAKNRKVIDGTHHGFWFAERAVYHAEADVGQAERAADVATRRAPA